jgi:uncharacterized protein (DUF433 family)
MDLDYSRIITIEEGKRSGQPCIRGMRITVKDVLEYLASGMTVDEILEDFPPLTREDVLACCGYAAMVLGPHSELPSDLMPTHLRR